MIVFFVVTGILGIALIVVLSSAKKEERKQITDMGFDVDEVEIFLDATCWDRNAFIESVGVRKAYETFHNTGSMGGIAPPSRTSSASPIVVSSVVSSVIASGSAKR